MKESSRRSRVIYTAGQYTGDTAEIVSQNIDRARGFAIKIWEIGYTVICPHLNTAHFEEDNILGYECIIQGDFELVSRCDAVFMLPGWTKSKGATRERLHALDKQIPIFHTLSELEQWVK